MRFTICDCAPRDNERKQNVTFGGAFAFVWLLGCFSCNRQCTLLSALMTHSVGRSQCIAHHPWINWMASCDWTDKSITNRKKHWQNFNSLIQFFCSRIVSPVDWLCSLCSHLLAQSAFLSIGMFFQVFIFFIFFLLLNGSVAGGVSRRACIHRPFGMVWMNGTHAEHQAVAFRREICISKLSKIFKTIIDFLFLFFFFQNSCVWIELPKLSIESACIYPVRFELIAIADSSYRIEREKEMER